MDCHCHSGKGGLLCGPAHDYNGYGVQAAGAFSTWSTKAVVGLLGIHMEGEQPVSEEEIKVLLQQGAKLGTFDKEEPEIIDNVFELNDRTAADCMTARPQLDWIDLEDSEKKSGPI